MMSLSVSVLLGLLVCGTNAAHIPSPSQLGDITVLSQNSLRSKLYANAMVPRVEAHHCGIDGVIPQTTC